MIVTATRTKMFTLCFLPPCYRLCCGKNLEVEDVPTFGLPAATGRVSRLPGCSMSYGMGRAEMSSEKVVPLFDGEVELPANDNTTEALKILRAANERFRQVPWPEPFRSTQHRIWQGDARDLSAIPDGSVDLVVTSPPYWTLKEYSDSAGANQLGAMEDYDEFLDELNKVWRECARVLVPGGRICCVVGDVCIPRRKLGRHLVMPLHADIQVRSREVGLDVLTPIIWHKIANGVTEVKGNGAGFYGKPYQPGAVVKNDLEYILFMRKGGEYRRVSPLQKALSSGGGRSGPTFVEALPVTGTLRRIRRYSPSV